MTAHLGLREAFVQLLLASPPIAEGRVFSGRRRPMPQAVNAEVYVDLDDAPSIPSTLSGSHIQWSTKLVVHCVARDTVGSSADKTADRLLEQVYARLMNDPRLGGVALNTNPAGLAWRTEEEAEQGLAACQALFEVLHRTARSSIAAN